MAREEFVSEEKEAFNMGIDMLKRIGKILDSITTAILLSDVDTWYKSVFALKHEIEYKLKKEEREEINRLFSKVSTMFSEYTRTRSSGVKKINPELYSYLEEIGTKLKEAMEKRGMLGLKQGDPSRALAMGF